MVKEVYKKLENQNYGDSALDSGDITLDLTTTTTTTTTTNTTNNINSTTDNTKNDFLSQNRDFTIDGEDFFSIVEKGAIFLFFFSKLKSFGHIHLMGNYGVWEKFQRHWRSYNGGNGKMVLERLMGFP